MHFDDVVIVESIEEDMAINLCEITEGRLDGEEVLAISVRVNQETITPLALTQKAMLELYYDLQALCEAKGLLVEED